MSRRVTLLVLAWNRWDLTERCLSTLLLTDLPDTEILVVDNGSTDETPTRLAALAEAGRIRVLTLPENVGFVRGNNAGLDVADPESDVVLLNNDLEFQQTDWLACLRATAASDEKIGIVGARLVLPDGRLLHAGTYILPDTCWGQQIGALEHDLGQYTAPAIPTSGIVFACAYLKRELIAEIGGLALDFESYFEDTDYCLRAAEKGWRTVVCGAANLIHDEHGSTQQDPNALGQLFQKSRAVFEKKWGARLNARYRRSVLWQSIMNFPTGYAMSCREILRALEHLGVRSTYRYVYGPKTVFPPLEPENSHDYLLNVLRGRPEPKPTEIGVVYGQADVFARNRGKYKIGYTMLEVDGFPADWVRAANKMDEVWVPTEFNREGFLASGLTRPIHKIPLGVDSNYFHPNLHRIPNPDGEFVFFSAFEWGERKEPEMLLKVFNETFSFDEPVRLLCKVINRDPAIQLKEEIRRLELRESGGKISYLLNLEFPHYQLGTLYRSTDCFVTTSRGEGWNMPLMEAMACGLPAIATDWGAHTEFLHAGNSYPLRTRGTVPAIAKCPYYTGFRWANPDPEHLRSLLRHVYENQDEARALGAAAAREIAERWTWRQTAQRITERLDAIAR